MAAVLLTFFISSVKPNPNRRSKTSTNSRPLCASWSPRIKLDSRTNLKITDFSTQLFGARLVLLDRRLPNLLQFASHEESNHSDIEVDKESELKFKQKASEEAWKHALDSFKEDARKMKELSQEAYAVYSKKAIEALKEASEAFNIQADKARRDLAIIANEICLESQVYFSTAAETSPECVRDIVETFTSLEVLKHDLTLRDFYLGIPYGAFLAVGGFLNFMLTGSIPAIRFGIILGSSLLAFSILSLRSWKGGKPSELFLKGQAVIATIIFMREWRLFSKMSSFPTLLMTFISGAMVAFYVYRLVINESKDGSTVDKSSEK